MARADVGSVQRVPVGQMIVHFALVQLHMTMLLPQVVRLDAIDTLNLHRQEPIFCSEAGRVNDCVGWGKSP